MFHRQAFRCFMLNKTLRSRTQNLIHFGPQIHLLQFISGAEVRKRIERFASDALAKSVSRDSSK